MSKINVNELDIERLDEIEELGTTFVKIPKKKKFDDGTKPSKFAKKKGSNRILDEEHPRLISGYHCSNIRKTESSLSRCRDKPMDER